MTWWLYKKLEDLLIRLQMKKYPRDKFFRIADEYEGLLPIEILEGAYKGTVFAIKHLAIEDDYGKTRYDHVIIKKIPGKHDSYYGEQFSKMVGEILLVCLSEAQENYHTIREEVMNDEEAGSDYFEEPSEERTIPAKGDPISKS